MAAMDERAASDAGSSSPGATSDSPPSCPEATGSAAAAAKPEAGGKEALLRQRTAVVLTPGHTFWHGGCVQRCCQILGLFLLLAICGSAIYAFVSPLLGAAALAMGPACIIMYIFYKRFQCSTTPEQAAYTFLEAIAWMCALMIIIIPVDYWNNKLTGVPTEFECKWRPDEGGKVFVHALSFAAHCHWPLGSSAPSGDWDGLNCSKLPLGLGNGSLPLPFSDDTAEDITGLPPLLLLGLDKAAANASGGQPCKALQDGLVDALGATELRSLSTGGKSVNATRHGIASAFDEFFGRSARINKFCPCKKQLRNGTLPAYDFCSKDGKCNVVSSNPGCVLLGEHACATAKEIGNVSAVIKYQRKTVLNSFITAFFRAAFLEELLKYLAVRRILFKDRVVDPGGLIVYGLSAAAGFATAENFQYTAMHGVLVTFARMLLSIPLHCCTGLMIGINLGYRKFLGKGYMCLDKFLLALAMPVFIHGAYDFVLMLPQSPVIIPQEARAPIAVSIMLLGFIACRCMWLRMDNVCIVHVKDLQRAGRVSKPQCCCCCGSEAECDCCRALCEQEDPLLKGKAKPAVPVQREASSDSEGEGNAVWRLSKSFSQELLPETPKCQTEEDTCPGCRNIVRVHILYPSDCPYCGYRFPDPAPLVSSPQP